VENCTLSGSIISAPSDDWDENTPSYCGGIVGGNKGTVSGCRFDGYLIGSTAGGIVGSNSGAVLNCQNIVGRIDNGGVFVPKGSTGSTGGIIGLIPSGINYADVVVTGNTFNIDATGQQWGIGQDSRLSTVGPSNNGAMPVPVP